jgi:hypothetical protein
LNHFTLPFNVLILFVYSFFIILNLAKLQLAG